MAQTWKKLNFKSEYESKMRTFITAYLPNFLHVQKVCLLKKNVFLFNSHVTLEFDLPGMEQDQILP